MDLDHFSSKVWHKPAPIPHSPRNLGIFAAFRSMSAYDAKEGLESHCPNPALGLLSIHSGQLRTKDNCSGLPLTQCQHSWDRFPDQSTEKQTLSCDCELDLCLDFPKLILGFTDVDGLVIQRGTWSTGGRSLSLVGLESPEQAPGWGSPSPAPPHLQRGQTPQSWRLAGCYCTAKLAQVKNTNKWVHTQLLLSMRSWAASSWLETPRGPCQPTTGFPSCLDQVTRGRGDPSTWHSRLTLSPTFTSMSPRGSGK